VRLLIYARLRRLATNSNEYPGWRMKDFLIIIMLLILAAAGCRKKEVTPVVPEPPPAELVQAPSAITPHEPRVAAKPLEAPPPDATVTSPEIIIEEPQNEAAAPPKIFVEAEQNFAAGNYRQAAQVFEKFLNTFPKAAERDQALLHFGFSLALSGDDQDLLQTEAALRRLITEFPKSPYRRDAELVLNMKTLIERLQSDLKERDERIRQLSDELRKLKSIDFDRRPSRPE